MTTPPLILAVETSSRLGSVALAFGEKMVAESGFSTPLGHSAEIFPAVRDLLARVGRKPSQIEHVYISCGPGSFSGLRIATTLAKIMHLANAARIVAVDTLDVIAANVVDLTGAASRKTEDRRQKSDVGPPTSEFGLPTERLAAVLDAKRGGFFIAVYERQTETQNVGCATCCTRGSLRVQNEFCTPYRAAVNRVWKKVLADSLMTIPEFLARFANAKEPIWLLGDGLVYYKDSFQAEGIRFFDQRYWSPHARNVHALGWHKALRGEFADPLTLTPNYLRTPDITMKSR